MQRSRIEEISARACMGASARARARTYVAANAACGAAYRECTRAVHELMSNVPAQ